LRAFCPGHITGFFAVDENSAEPLRQGSVGVGFCVETGAVASVSVQRSERPDVKIDFDGAARSAPVTEHAVNSLLPDGGWSVNADLRFQAPLGQGFGMSAAGTYAACLALAEMVGRTRDDALAATHRSEIHHRTGLGDAIAQSVGGFVQRDRAGIPPHGSVKKLDIDPVDVVVCLLDTGVDTASVLGSPDIVENINDVGKRCMNEFIKKPDLENFIARSWMFATETGLATTEIERIIGSISGIGKGSMIMLGNGVFAFGDADALQTVLKDFGQVIRTKISTRPAGLLF